MFSSEILKRNYHKTISFFSLLAIVVYIVFTVNHLPYPNLALFIIIIMGGIPLVLQILFNLLKGDLGADALAAIAIITAVILNEYLAAVFIILMLSGGQALEFYAMRKASSVLLALAERMPNIVHIKMLGKIRDIHLNEIRVGDEVVIYPHETCPVDGTVIEGHGSMDESYLTGEPYQISKAPGTQVLSGAINGESLLIIKATKLPADSRYAEIVKVLQDAEQKKPKIRRLADQLGAIFTPVALLFALLAWYFTGESIRFLAVLVIATPCPLIIAIPITMISAISIAARQSIIIKDPTVLEKLPICKTAIFDKTGTLTYGKPRLTEIVLNSGIDENFILQNVASLERYSKHPLAGAILEAANKKGLAFLEVSKVSELPGKGLEGIVDGHEVIITSRKHIKKYFPPLIDSLPETATGLECIILYDKEYLATCRFRDIPRQETKSFIKHLGPSHQFEKIMLVSGDRESEVKYLGEMLDLSELHHSQSPEQKVSLVKAERKNSPTMFMGDGINDAPAIMSATVGIAFGQYSNVTSESAGAVIMENNLEKVDQLIHLSLSTRKIALQSAIGGMILSFIGMGFASAGYITPVAGAIIQEIIDIFAIANALRLTWQHDINTDLLND